jgi:hypothetical protein
MRQWHAAEWPNCTANGTRAVNRICASKRCFRFDADDSIQGWVPGLNPLQRGFC